MYIRTHTWNEQTSIVVAGEIVEVTERETVQARSAIGDTARCYWPMDLVEPFVRKNYIHVHFNLQANGELGYLGLSAVSAQV